MTLGLSLIGLTAIFISIDYRTKRTWSVPIGPIEDYKLDNTADYSEALEIIHSDYQLAQSEREGALTKKAFALNSTLYMFITSVIILILLKIGG